MAQRAFAIDPLAEDQLAQAGAVLARAFLDYPLFSSVFTDFDERSRVVHANMMWLVHHACRFGDVVGIGNPLIGASLMFPPGDDPFSSERIAQSGYHELAEQIGTVAWDRLEGAPQMFYGEADLTRIVTHPHWHLDAIAVDPAHQGQGVGSTLLDAIHTTTDADGRPVALVTHDPRTIPLYLRHGYKLIFEGMEPTSDVHHWGFLRDRPR
jgi:GNAT superfamily N-acetyltransferase